MNKGPGAIVLWAVAFGLCFSASASPASRSLDCRLRFSVSFPAEKAKVPLDGRVLLFISSDGSSEPRFQVSDGPNTQLVFGVDADGLAPGEPAVFDGCVFGYPLNIGGKPYNSWPSFIPITFELTILCAGLATVFGMLVLNGLPTPYHPVFNAPRFELATHNRFFLCIEARDPMFDAQKTRQFLESLKAYEVSEIES